MLSVLVGLFRAAEVAEAYMVASEEWGAESLHYGYGSPESIEAHQCMALMRRMLRDEADRHGVTPDEVRRTWHYCPR